MPTRLPRSTDIAHNVSHQTHIMQALFPERDLRNEMLSSRISGGAIYLFLHRRTTCFARSEFDVISGDVANSRDEDVRPVPR